MVLLTECANIFSRRALLSMHVVNICVFGPLVDKATVTLSIKKSLY